MASSTPFSVTGILVAFNDACSSVLLIGTLAIFGFGWFVFQAETWAAAIWASALISIMGSALWVMCRPSAVSPSTSHESLLSLQRRAKANHFKQILSCGGAVFGALMILLIGFLIFFNGSKFAGLLFFCSGAMAMRAAWTLLWGQHGVRGKLG